MNDANAALITRFYTAMQTLNYKEMQQAYHPDARFSDPVFENLKYQEVTAMWEMLLTRGRDLRITFGDIETTALSGKCRWEAWYTFSKTGRHVHNIVHSSFDFKDGKIYRQCDMFDLWRWTRYALGPTGWLVGWSSGVQNKIRHSAKESLKKFMMKESAVNS